MRDVIDEGDIVRHPPFGDFSCMCAMTWALSTSAPGLFTITRSGRSSHFGCGSPMAAASSTPGQPTAVFSSSIEEIHSPPDLITSLERSVMFMKPYSSMVATSPVSNQPSASNAEAPSPL